jgi:dTDP-4-amino-4,6-dideoxygalactose transaminase
MTAVPFVDLHAQYLTINEEIDTAISEIIRDSAFVRGPAVEKFEIEYAELMQAKHCVSGANGTDTLYIAMHALGIKPGDEVIVPAQSWISTSETVGQHGAKAVFADIDMQTHTIDPADIEAKITARTVGIIPVHLYGQAADMDPIMEIARRRGLWVLEDCAQAHLATYKGHQVGTFGDIASWSFYPGKNLGAMGDAGAATTDSDDLAYRMARFARHGGIKKGDHEIEGINSRLDGLQAAILRVKLPHLAQWTARRRAAAARYDALLADIASVEIPVQSSDRQHVYHLYVIESGDRDALATSLTKAGVPTVVNYRRALPFLPAYADRGHTAQDFPNAFRLQGRILSIPIYAEISELQQQVVADAIRAFCAA